MSEKTVMSRFQSIRAVLVGLVALGLGAAVFGPSAVAAAPAPSLRLGVTHGQHSLNPWGSASAVASGRELLASRPGTLQNQHVMGWGTINPEPSPGVFDWSTLDRRMKLIRETGGTPVITLCCAPDWMKGGAAGRTDWTRLEVAPAVKHFDDYAELAAAVARRYPDVRHYQVWNEMKGFWDSQRNRWRYEDYTTLYNKVFRALKGVDPTIQVGGPYVSMVSWRHGVGGGRNSTVSGPWGMVDQRALDVITYWLAHADGADFIAVDGPSSLRDGTFLVPPAESAQKFAAVNEWIRARTSLPIWWSELHPIPFGTSGQYRPSEEAAIWASTLGVVERSGASVALLWQPEGSAAHTGLWTSTASPGGGQPTALYQRLAGRM